MFDSLVERGTGQVAVTDVPAEVVLLMTPERLLALGIPRRGSLGTVPSLLQLLGNG